MEAPGRRWAAVAVAVAAALGGGTATAAAQERGPTLLAGVGRADITPPTGYAFGGWTRADRIGRGVHTRLRATALVLQRGERRVALMAVDLFAAPGGLVKEAAERAGFTEREVLVSASHTHAGPSGFANFPTFNTLAPSVETIDRPETFAGLLAPGPPDRQLYTFLVDRIALALRRAARSTRAAAVGWSSAQLPGVTRNRSLEAHLADHGIAKDRGAGRPEDDPEGAAHTVDQQVDVLRVDRVVRRRGKLRRIPIGAWSSFANHGTVVPSEYPYYHQDHHAAALRVFEDRVRRAGRVAPGRLVVNVYGNSNEGDMSAGLDRQGPGEAERVGRLEAGAMFRAWRDAGRRLSRRPALDLRWTRTCFCGQQVEGGRVADAPLPGLPFLTGSEEGRGPLHDLTRLPLEDRRSPVGHETQGHKIGVPAASADSVPKAVPLLVVRVGDRMIASLPGEPTVEVGRRVRRAVLARAAGAGVRHVVVAGLANEFLLYLTTPEEYERQHYEGGSTLFGPRASVLLTEQLGELAARLVAGRPAPEAHPFDPRNGVTADGPPFPDGASDAVALAQPAPGRAAFGWQGGPRGFDRPLDTPFVSVERRTARGWVAVADDLGLDVRWIVDDEGRYTAEWLRAGGAGEHRFVVTARRYRLVSAPWRP